MIQCPPQFLCETLLSLVQIPGQTTNYSHYVMTVLRVENLYVEVNMYVMLWSSPLIVRSDGRRSGWDRDTIHLQHTVPSKWLWGLLFEGKKKETKCCFKMCFSTKLSWTIYNLSLDNHPWEDKWATKQWHTPQKAQCIFAMYGEHFKPGIFNRMH